MLSDQAPISRLRLHAPALPEVKALVNNLRLPWPKRHAAKLQTITMAKPPWPQCNAFAMTATSSLVWNIEPNRAIGISEQKAFLVLEDHHQSPGIDWRWLPASDHRLAADVLDDGVLRVHHCNSLVPIRLWRLKRRRWQ